MLKIFEKDTEEWKEAMEDLQKASSQVRELMAVIPYISLFTILYYAPIVEYKI